MFFWACNFQGLTQDLGFHGLAAKQAFQFADTVFKLADAAQGNDLLISPYGFLPTLTHTAPPLKQQAWGDAIKPGNGRDRHARLHSLFDQPDLFLGSIAPTALNAGDDFNTLNRLRHRRMPRLTPRPSRLRQVSGRIGGWSKAQIRSAGFSLLDMRSFLARRGSRAEGVRLPLDKLAEAGVPAVALVDTNGYRHFVLLRGISSATPTQASLSSFDVAGGKRLSADEFRRLAADKTLDRRMPNGARLLVHVAADGAQRLKRQGMNGQTATDRGRVAYRGDQVCSNWERINPGQETCFVYFQLGQDLVAIDLAGAMAPTRLNLPRGNPERV